MRVDHELRLAGELNAVPRARRFVASTLAEYDDETVVADAELAVSELVTNALLHAGPEVRVRVSANSLNVRLEVYDGGQAAPIRGAASAGAMTGRGLALVEQLATVWGVDWTDDGKCVWCEISTEAGPPPEEVVVEDADVEALLTTWDDRETGPDSSSEPVFTVKLGSVPTTLLLAAKEHIDNVVREFTLAAAGAASGASAAIPADMAVTIDTVVNRFAHVRQLIKRQALAAAARGETRTELTLTLPLSMAETGEAYLDALDEADSYAHAERMLTLETLPEHKAFRRWYVETLSQQLRAAAAGQPTAGTRTFEEYLLDELSATADARHRAESLAGRLGHLQALTAELTRTGDREAIAQSVVQHARGAFGARFAALYMLSGEELHAVSFSGTSQGAAARWQTIPLSEDLPVTRCAKSGEPTVVPPGQLTTLFPAIVTDATERTVACVPLNSGDDVIGVLALTFPSQRDLTDPAEIDFLTTLADACAQAIERADAMAMVQSTSDNLSFLAEASAAMNASLDYRTTLKTVADLVVPRLADWCAVQTIGDDGLDNIAVAHIDPAKVRFAREIQQRYPTDLDATSGVPNVIRSGKSELYPQITDDMLVATARDEEHLRIARELGLRSAMIVPLTGASGTFGAITFCHAESGRTYGDGDLVLAEEVANRAALAVEHAAQFRDQTGRLAAVTRVAEAAQRAILAPVPEVLGPLRLAAAYASAAREASVGGDMYEVVRTHGTVRMMIADARGKGLDAVRLATVVLGFFRSTAVEWTNLDGLARQIDSRLQPYLEPEDFVTALLVEVSDAGRCEVTSCGHYAPVILHRGSISHLDCPPSLPLGLGAAPRSVHTDLDPGDRLLLYTDGLIDARSSDGGFTDVDAVVAPLADGDVSDVLPQVLSRLHQRAGVRLTDDLALLVAEYRPDFPRP